MSRRDNPNLKGFSTALRKNQTKEEKHLWYDFLRNYPVKIYRQRVIDQYIVDFYCSAAKLVIELDGSQHYTVEGEEYDSIRTETLERYHLCVLRFSNLEIDHNFSGVCEKIEEIISLRKDLCQYGFHEASIEIGLRETTQPP